MCVSVQLSGGGGDPIQLTGGGGGYPISGLDRGETPNSIPGLDRVGVPHPRSGLGGGYPIPGLDRGRVGSRSGGEGWYPTPGQDGGYPHPGQDWMGYPPPVQDWMGYLCPIRQSSITSTCYTAGGMPLALMQEDFVYKQECLSALCHASFVDVYLAYLKSYGHLKIVKCIGMY